MERSQIIFEGTDIAKYSSKEWKKFRGKECSMIFQDALVSLNPTMKIGKQIMESLDNHAVTTSKEEKKKKEQKETKKKHTTGIVIGAVAVVIFALLVVFMRKRM